MNSGSCDLVLLDLGLPDLDGMEIIQKNIPDVLEHPLLEVGRSFIFNDALPYIEDMVTEESLAAFKADLEALG